MDAAAGPPWTATEYPFGESLARLSLPVTENY